MVRGARKPILSPVPCQCIVSLTLRFLVALYKHYDTEGAFVPDLGPCQCWLEVRAVDLQCAVAIARNENTIRFESAQPPYRQHPHIHSCLPGAKWDTTSAALHASTS
jgi:hypothetical protein